MADRAALALTLGERVRPVSLAKERVLEVDGPLASLLPGRALQRGTTVAVSGVATSLALALVASVSTATSWVAAVGLGRLGLAAAEELGVALERLLLVDPVPAGQWAAVVASLVEAVDVVVVGPPSASVAAGQARRVIARLREQGAVLIQVGWPPRSWPDRPELVLTARPLGWRGIGVGHGVLQARQVEVTLGGRHGADRGRTARFWLPDAHGRLAAVEPAVEPAVALGGEPGATEVAALSGPLGGGVVGVRRPRLSLLSS